ncbi:MAG TPA: alpha/beta hydrolase domain-containing protein [Opitutaceae bacterium]|nr:alpha/beta hydrolase domain-containing protein [Opitutaceae bacterium]
MVAIPIFAAARVLCRRHLPAIAASACLAVLAARAPARVVRVDIATRTPILNGRAFGHSGAYEKLTGRVIVTLDVSNPHNHAIVDLANAETRDGNNVTFAADFIAVQPTDPQRGNGSMILEIPNRGHSGIIGLVDGGDRDPNVNPGDAWLLERGYSIVSLGWQWDAAAPDALRLIAPVARQDGRSITGLLRGDLMPSHPMAEIPLGHLIVGTIGGIEYPVADPEDPRNVLTVRDTPTSPRTVIPRSEWRFARMQGRAEVPSNHHIRLNGGFQPGKIYEYVYVVSNPVVAGGGFAVVRDFASYAKHASSRVMPADRVYGEGISQNGRFLRDFLYEGFNADEEGRRALDGVLAHVAGAGRGSFNYRFAQPSRDAQPTSSIFFPTDLFPFTDRPETDPVTGETSGLLDRAVAEHVVPKIFFSNTSYEYWGRAAALIHITPDGTSDAAISPDVRIYHFTGLQHFSGPFPPARGRGDLVGQNPESPLPVRFFWRAMIAAMDAWARGSAPPPPSCYPRIDDGTLVPLARYAFPAIPGVARPTEASAAYHLDFGSGWRNGVLRNQPPIVGKPFPVLVPQVDADGNEADGIRLPELTVPLATYTGWNLRDAAIGAPTQRVSFEGSYLPFPRTRAERLQTHDPRRSIEERYRDRADYLARFGQAVDELVRRRWILPEDRAALLQRGEQEWDDVTRNGSR